MRIQKGLLELRRIQTVLKDEGKYKTPFETVKGLFGFENESAKAQFGYMGSNRGKSNLNQSLKVAGTTALGSIYSKNSSPMVTQYNRKNDAWVYNTNMDAMFARPGNAGGYTKDYVDYYENNTCPPV